VCTRGALDPRVGEVERTRHVEPPEPRGWRCDPCFPRNAAEHIEVSTADSLQSALSGRYVVERELGRGGMATVFLARDLRHARAVAVKVMMRDVVAPSGAERFLHEIRIAARLTHPHVLGVHDSGEADGLLYYVMPFVEGETLRARLEREGALPIADTTRLLRELADALAYAHARGVVHRDLKPENVLLSGGHAVIADFGIAKALAAATHPGNANAPALTATGVSLGTPAYMAPEQAVGDRSADHRADLYALGVIAYELLAGEHPFGARSAQALVAAHLTEDPSPLVRRRPDVPRALAALVARLLAKDPAARPQSAEMVVQSLDAALALPAPTRMRPTRTALAVAVALVGFAGIASYAALHDKSSTASIRTLAVLPFVNTGGNAADDYFSDGLTDELAHALARLPGLQVAGRTSSYSFKGKVATAQEIGRTLDVAALIEGTVRRAGDRLRITTQLVGTADGKVLWDSVYESRSSDVFGVQDQLTRAVVAAIAPALGNRPADEPLVDVGRGTTDVEAYELYLKGRYYWLARGAENVTRSIDYFQQAIARDPQFARAHAGLALAYSVLPVYIADSNDSVPALTAASAERALALDSTLADAQIAAAIMEDQRLRLAEAMTHYRKAIALEPSSPFAHHAFGHFLLMLGRTDEAVRETALGARLDPLAKSAGASAALALGFARRGREAIVESRRILALDSTFALAFQTLGVAQGVIGETDSAVRSLERARQLAPAQPGVLGKLIFAYAAAGKWADAARIRAELHGPDGDRSGGIEAAFADYIFGDREPLVRLLTSEAGQRRWHEQYAFGCNPLIDPLWSDERFVVAMKKLTIEPCPLARPWPFSPPRQ
jgi:serine/threonine-protein kinase